MAVIPFKDTEPNRDKSKKLCGFIETVTTEFTKAAQLVEAKRLQMVERHRTARREQQAGHDERWKKEMRERADRFRKGLLGLWDRVSGKHAKLRSQNELEVIVSKKRDTLEKQQLIDKQLAERQQLQYQIKNERQLHARELARTHRALRSNHLQKKNGVDHDNRRRRNIIGPAGP